MLREEWIERAASVHAVGARMLRDGVAVLLPCLPFGRLKEAFTCSRILADAERNLSWALSLSQGLIESTLTKYTAAAEARTRLLGVDLDASLLSMHAAAARGRVQPGTRTDIYNGFLQLSSQAPLACDAFATLLDDLLGAVRDGSVVFALPLCVLHFLKRIATDYRAACRLLAEGENALFPRRPDLAAELLGTLRRSAADYAEEPSCETLASLAASGKLPVLPPLLYDMALRYERLPAVGFERKESAFAHS